MITLPFTKMVGTGNDFIVVDASRNRLRPLKGRWKIASRGLCDRHNGIGADGLLVLEPSKVAHVKMRVFNPDGSEAQMCGNGARCVALYLQATSNQRPATRRKRVTIETTAGVLSGLVRGNRVAMRMTDPTHVQIERSLEVNRRRLRVGFLDTGVPHVVVPVADLDAVNVATLGRAVRYHGAFAPQGTNVDFVQADSANENRLRVRTYERGVEAETQACGTGIVASALFHALRRELASGQSGPSPTKPRRRFWRLNVQARSGERLRVSCAIARDARGLRVSDVTLEGAAQRIFEGTVEWPMGRGK